MEEKKTAFSLEENFARLEDAIDRLGNDELPLEEAFQTYSLGMTILKECNDQIDRVEKQVLKLTEEGQLEEFENGES